MGHGDRFLVPSSVLSGLSNCLKGWDKEPVPVSHPASYYCQNEWYYYNEKWKENMEVSVFDAVCHHPAGDPYSSMYGWKFCDTGPDI